MHAKRAFMPLFCAIVLVAVSFAAQSPSTTLGRACSATASTITGSALDAESFAAGSDLAARRLICADAFDDPRPYCRGCCGSRGQIRKWVECCDRGEDTDCAQRWCGRNRSAVAPAP